MKTILGPIAVFTAVVIWGGELLCNVLYVDGNNTLGPWAGTAALPFRLIQDGINAAAAGDLVQVAAGTYRENIAMKSGVSVAGAGADATSIVGAPSGDGVVKFGGILNARLSGFKITVSSRISGVDRGVVIVGGDSTVILERCLITAVQYGIFIESLGSPTIQNNTLAADPVSNWGEQGIYVQFWKSPDLLNNIIAGYSFCGIHFADVLTEPPVIFHNDLWNNGSNYLGYPDQTGQNGNISADPLFRGAADYHLQSGSPCIDAGDPASPDDPDRTRADTGAFYFHQAMGPCSQQPPVNRLHTGFDDSLGLAIAGGQADDNYRILGNLAVDCATVVPDSGFPFGPWAPNGPQSKWIGKDSLSSSGPDGVYTFELTVRVPAFTNAAALKIEGSWTSDNATQDILVNGVSTGISNSGDFTALGPFPPNAGLGLFHTGDNTVQFLVKNDPLVPPPGPWEPYVNPVGLRVDAILSAASGPSCFEDLPLGWVYLNGHSFTTAGVPAVLVDFITSSQTTVPNGFCRVENTGKACGSGNEIRLSNANLLFQFPSPIQCLEINYGEYGASVDVEINGHLEVADDFTNLPPAIGGVLVTATAASGCGTLRTSGAISSFKIGGDELWIDCIDLNPGNCSAPTGGPQRPGDMYQDGWLDIADPVLLLGYLFLKTPGKDMWLPCGDGTAQDPANIRLLDVNGDGTIDISDAVSLLAYLFRGGNPPVLGQECVFMERCPAISNCR